jgi:hypothetical protein
MMHLLFKPLNHYPMIHLTFLLAMPGGSEWVVVLLGLGLYFLPTVLASIHEKSNAGAIFALNLFLGWTLIGWVISLVWALSTDRSRMPAVIVNNTSQVHSQEYKAERVQEKAQLQSEASDECDFATGQDRPIKTTQTIVR